MADDFTHSIREGESGGMPQKPQHDNPPREIGRVKIGKIVEIPISGEMADKTMGAAIQFCKASFEKWKAAHPDATRTPIRYSQCSAPEPSAPPQDHRPKAPSGHQH